MSALSKVRGVTVRKDDTRKMEDEARRMELKIEMLRKAMDGDTNRSGSAGGESGSRWKSGSSKKPLRNGYVKEVLEAKPPARAEGIRRPHVDSTLRQPVTPEVGGSHSSSRVPSGRTTPTQVEPQGTFSSALTGQQPLPMPHAPTTGGKAAANLQAVMQQQSREALEVEAFLAGLGLDRYVSIFMENGFDCMEVVQEMEESHMRDIGMAAGHALKLRKRIVEMKPAPAKPSTPVRPSTPGSLAGATQRRVTFGSTEQQAIRSPSGGMGSGTGGGGSLLDGHYDEAENRASFQEAVRAWREGRTLEEGAAAERSTAPASKPGAFWSSVGGDEVNLERCSTPLSTNAETATAPGSTQHDLAPSEDKLCCYQCFKQFYAKYAVERCSPLDGTARRLCSTSCADLWAASMQAKAEELQKRHEKLAKLEEMKRAMEYELKASAVEANSESVQAPLCVVAS
jgi:hypothetical protein